jgi:hypothetical protein
MEFLHTTSLKAALGFGVLATLCWVAFLGYALFLLVAFVL